MEDGGLALLIAHLLWRSSTYQKLNCRFRVFAVHAAAELETERKNLIALLAMFRIEAEVIIVHLEFEASAQTVAYFQKSSELSDEEMKDKRVIYFMTLSERMREYSKHAMLVVASLPIPRLSVTAKKYFTYLEMLTDKRPTILVRGNQEAVLTHHS